MVFSWGGLVTRQVSPGIINIYILYMGGVIREVKKIDLGSGAVKDLQISLYLKKMLIILADPEETLHRLEYEIKRA